ncbi:hypothetical protein [Lentzea sp. NBRC 102530]|uniref:hypothetical protein n=1 Tax=Lentzea sp. NBRC 102530 TaxID=3032201 RepID=UPI0024A4407F|nr:hypothetical protein [Lentzea sp. NBRC 102530]GLY51445.1 hypothetical protein Lesp01_51010 [Lentzea sp. NBRC 102530]
MRVVVELSFAQASVLARAAVVVTSALECKEVNAADQGLLTIRRAVALALSQDIARKSGGPAAAPSVPELRAS